MKYIALFALIGLLAVARASTPFDVVDNQEYSFPYKANLPLSLRVKNPTVNTVVRIVDTDSSPGFEAKFTLTSPTSSEVSFGGTALTLSVPLLSTDFIVVFIVTATDTTTVSFSAILYTNTGSSSSNGNTAATSSSGIVGDVKRVVTGSVSRVTVYPFPYVLSQSEASAIFGANGDCFDSVQNNMETAVDCGGSQGCATCTCSDNVQNQGEFGSDCGFPCFGQCPNILDVPFDTFSGGATSGVQSFTGLAAPSWVSDFMLPDAGEPKTRYGVLLMEGDDFGNQPKGHLVPVTFASKFTVRLIASFAPSLDNGGGFVEGSLLNCGDNLYLYVLGTNLVAKLRGVTDPITLVGLVADGALGADWQDVFVVVTPTTISGQIHYARNDPVPFSVSINPPNPAPTTAAECTIGSDEASFGIYYDRVTIYNGLALSSVQQNEMYDFPPALGQCADGIKNGDETGVDCGSSCSRVCPTDDGGNGGGGNDGNTCPNCAAGTNLQVIPSSGIRGGEYGLVSTSGTCITVRVHA